MNIKYQYYSELEENNRLYYYKICRDFLGELRYEYRGFCEWYESLFRKDAALHSERDILMCLSGKEIAGITILKDTLNEKKICTLRVKQEYQRRGIGRELLKKSVKKLHTEKPLITVREDQYTFFDKLFKEFGFILKQKKYDYYSFMGIEYVFNGFLPDRECHSILLPIHPTYANLIYNNTKKFEFRKKLCKEYVDRIYLYETSPIKAVTGVVEITERLRLPIDVLWKFTKKEAGVGIETFSNYYCKHNEGCAYRLGHYLKFNTPLSVLTFGLKSGGQSFQYLLDEQIPFEMFLANTDTQNLDIM